MGNGNVVWSPEKGWHDGPPATVEIDESGRIRITPENAPESETREMFHVVYLPANQAYAVMFGAFIGTASILRIVPTREEGEYLIAEWRAGRTA